MKYNDEFQSLQAQVDDYLKAYFDSLVNNTQEKSLIESMAYSVMSGGKRIRPVLSLATAKMLNGSVEKVMPIAASIEMVHTYSLIHDDLPAMDNDDLRRGRPTNHIVYGEAMAILAGDALLNEAYELLLKTSRNSGAEMEQALRAFTVVAEASGRSGMICGQVLDEESEGRKISAEALKQIHQKKTGALIKASIIAPSVLIGAYEEVVDVLSQYADAIGVAFQIKDDILDVVGSAEKLGKPIGSDAKNQKTTYASLYGLEGAKKMLNESTNKAVNALERFGDKAWFLKETAFYIANRCH